jgi:hypothetical protein
MLADLVRSGTGSQHADTSGQCVGASWQRVGKCLGLSPQEVHLVNLHPPEVNQSFGLPRTIRLTRSRGGGADGRTGAQRH